MSHEALDPEAHKVGHILIEVHVGNDGHLYVSHEVEGDMPLAAALGYMELTKDTMLHPSEDD